MEKLYEKNTRRPDIMSKGYSDTVVIVPLKWYTLRNVESAYIHHFLRSIGVKQLFFILYCGQKGENQWIRLKSESLLLMRGK